VTRFLLDTLRPPDLDMRYLGLTPAQYGSIFLLGFGVWKLSRRSMQMAPRPTSAS
jgi:phosphatidylglycerol---prolipoprotein diacylglyceryl transferase